MSIVYFCLLAVFLGSHTKLSNGRRVCLYRVSRQVSDAGVKFHLYRKSGSPTKNITLDFAPEVVIYPKSNSEIQMAQNEEVCEAIGSLR